MPAATPFSASSVSGSKRTISVPSPQIQNGVTYDIHWDNLATSVVPEPASAAMAGVAVLGLLAARRRRA